MGIAGLNTVVGMLDRAGRLRRRRGGVWRGRRLGLLRLEVLAVEVLFAHNDSILLRRTGLPPSTASVSHIPDIFRQYVNTIFV
ncbi:hypothetical protein BTO20_36895 (plasmid) [Mycobacterium dioxanotrophicus]|uniref:Uncharacterized protein n=1 Tax=Mycobacterium dioxanotrophicus TaxID=482462 RepID=A0A1Y0CG12_9MYCO|nr:hypothetical protein BTO20_36895 [Mycobacterium dioxanotrophicus]